MSNFFLYLIYVCFVMYGWVASLLGGVWPSLSKDIGTNISMLGILVMINYATSGISSLFTYKIRMKLGTNFTTIFGLICASISMVIFANASSFILLSISVVFLGIGCGIIDINSNSYVVKAYDTKRVSFMHACWGLGATIGPMVMSFAMIHLPNYRYGFYFTFIILLIAIIFLLFAKKYWEKKKKSLDESFVKLHSVTKEEIGKETNLLGTLKIKNAVKISMCFFFANGAGCSLSAWLATMAVEQRGINYTEATFAASIFFFALMVGRIFFGILSSKCGISFVMKLCATLSTIFAICYYIPYNNFIIVLLHSALIGFLSGSIIPLLNANTKDLFEEKYISKIIGIGGAVGLAGIALISALMTFVVNILTINNIQIVQIISFALIFILYCSIEKNKVHD